MVIPQQLRPAFVMIVVICLLGLIAKAVALLTQSRRIYWGLTNGLCQPEVGDLGRAVLGEQDVVRLQVAVDDAGTSRTA